MTSSFGKGVKAGSTIGTLAAATPFVGPLAVPIGGLAGGLVESIFPGTFGGDSNDGDGPGKKYKKFARGQNQLENRNREDQIAQQLQLAERANKLLEFQGQSNYHELLKQFNSDIKTRTQLNNQAVSLAKDSIKAFDETVNLNDISATMAMNDAARVRNQNIEELNNNVELIKLDFAQNKLLNRLTQKATKRGFNKAKKQTGFATKDVNIQLDTARGMQDISEQEIDDALVSLQAQSAFDQTEINEQILEAAEMLGYEQKDINRILEEAKDLAALNRNTIRNTMESQLKEAEYNHTGLSNDLKNKLRDGKEVQKELYQDFKSKKNIADENLKIREKELAAEGYTTDAEFKTLKGEQKAITAKATQGKKDIIEQKKFKESSTLASLRKARAEHDFAQQELSLMKDEKYAEAAAQTEQMRREGLMQQSAQIARGQSGRSARKSVQGIAFANQQAQQLIAKAITRADSKFAIDKNRLANSLNESRLKGLLDIEYNKYLAESGIENQAIGLDKASADYDAAKSKFKAKAEMVNAKKNQSKIAEYELESQERAATNKIRDINDEYKDLRQKTNLSLKSTAKKLEYARKNQLNEIEGLNVREASQKNKGTIAKDRLRSQYDFAADKAVRAFKNIGFKDLMSGRSLEQRRSKSQLQTQSTLDRGGLNINELARNLLFSQKDFQDEFTKNGFAQYALERQTALSLKTLGTASRSADQQLDLTQDRIAFEKYLANRSAKSVLMDMPKVPDLIPGPLEPPPVISDPIDLPDLNALYDVQSLAVKAKTPFNASQSGEFNAFMGSIQDIAQMGTEIASIFKGPEERVRVEQQKTFSTPSPSIAKFDRSILGENFGVGSPDLTGFAEPINTPIMETLYSAAPTDLDVQRSFTI